MSLYNVNQTTSHSLTLTPSEGFHFLFEYNSIVLRKPHDRGLSDITSCQPCPCASAMTAMVASSLVLRLAKHGPASGYLQLLFPQSGLLILCMAYSHISFRSLPDDTSWKKSVLTSFLKIELLSVPLTLTMFLHSHKWLPLLGPLPSGK